MGMRECMEKEMDSMAYDLLELIILKSSKFVAIVLMCAR